MSQTPSERPSERNGAAELTASARHRLLADPQRRVVLQFLADGGTPVELDELAAFVAARETTGRTATAEETELVKTRLHHVHLPKLDDEGVLDYDAGTNRVESWRLPAGLL